MRRLLLLIPTTSYKTASFLDAARRIGVEVVIGSNRRQVLESYSRGGTLTLNFRNLATGTQQIIDYSRENPLEAVVSVDDETMVLAANASLALGLHHNSIESALALRNKFQMRKILSKGGMPSPNFNLFSVDGDPNVFAAKVGFPCVLKPTFLAASRGVILANNPKDFRQAFERIKKILKDPDVQSLGGDAAKEILVEDYIPGVEVALEGLLIRGDLQTLALFDKPDLLEGPFFEETLYVTPSRLSESHQNKIAQSVSQSAKVLGLLEGPVHAELRLNEKGIWLIEIAGRTIGGLCSRMLRFGTGLTLEEVILRHALRLPIESMEREKQAVGVMMIPIPFHGILKKVKGKDKAKRVPGVQEVSILIRTGQKIVPLPEGHRYLGFIFAKAESPQEVESALRESHQRLQFVIEPV